MEAVFNYSTYIRARVCWLCDCAKKYKKKVTVRAVVFKPFHES